jgi:glycosyltransferase involved in cell wall biosynthesis
VVEKHKTLKHTSCLKLMKVSIVVPAYNEEKRIGKMLQSYSEYFNGLVKSNILNYEILVVINNTRDKTEEVVREIARKNQRIKYLNLKEGGKGFAVIEGFKEVLKKDSDLIGFVDADLATSPEAYYDLIKNIGKYDGAIASRYLAGSEITPSYTFRRAVVAKVFNFLVTSLFPLKVTDTQCGAKLFNRRATEIIAEKVKMSQWAFDVELLYVLRKRGFRVIEIPTKWTDIAGSKIRLIKSSVQMFLSIIQLRIVYSKFRRIMGLLRPITSLFWRLVK